MIMRELQLQVVARSTCRQSYEDYATAVIDETVLCTHFPDDGKEACDVMTQFLSTGTDLMTKFVIICRAMLVAR